MAGGEPQDTGWVLPDGKLIGDAEMETELLRQSQQCEAALDSSLVALLRFYRQTGQRERLACQAERLVALRSEPTRRAECCLWVGVLMEGLADFEAAASFYHRILPLEPGDRAVWYFAHNNLGYCLIQLERFAEAEGFCRRAIEIDPGRHNAHKNLGLALGGQKQYLRAAESLIVAARLEPRDPRAMRHLDQLLGDHPEVLEGQRNLAAAIEMCRRRGDVG